MKKTNEELSEFISKLLYFVGLGAFILGFATRSNNEIVANILFLLAVVLSGYHIVFEGIGDTFRNSKREKSFQPNVHFLMSLATLGAVIIGNYEEAAMLIVIFAGAHFLEEYVDEKSKKEITNLLSLNPTEARLILPDNSTKIVSVDSIKVGDTLQVLNGDQVPTDGTILSGTTSIDESSINGESVPKEKSTGDEVFGSTINGSGAFTMIVTKDSTETVFANILKLVNKSQNSLTRTGTLIQRLEPKYVTTVLAIYPLVLLSGYYLFNWTWEVSLYRSIVYLISVSPCALAASAVPATLSTISNLSKQGVLVKGGSYLSKLQELKAISFDKTGTLTTGKPVVTDYYFSKEINENDLIDIIVAMEKKANHPLATAIVEKFKNRKKINLQVTNTIGKGLTSIYLNQEYRIGKPSTFEKVSQLLLEKEKEASSNGRTVVFISENEVVVGMIAMMDVPNQYSKEAVSYFNSVGVHTTMITGDARLTGEAIGKEIGVQEIVANVMPEDKANIIKEQQKKYGVTAMLGDGVNDAPALVTADIGIAMGEGTDVAMDAADIVLMKNDLLKLTYAHKLSQKMNKITWQNICFSMLIVLLLVISNFLGKMNIAIGVVMHEGSTLLVILNGLRLLRTPKLLSSIKGE